VPDTSFLPELGLPLDFGSTKGRQVKGNKTEYCKVKTKREYRQYMLRKGKGELIE
ncbi:hypothetical protein KIPB_005280, partial [Kipferlia bialata]